MRYTNPLYTVVTRATEPDDETLYQLFLISERDRQDRLDESKRKGDYFRKLSLQTALNFDASKYERFNCVTAEDNG